MYDYEETKRQQYLEKAQHQNELQQQLQQCPSKVNNICAYIFQINACLEQLAKQNGIESIGLLKLLFGLQQHDNMSLTDLSECYGIHKTTLSTILNKKSVNTVLLQKQPDTHKTSRNKLILTQKGKEKAESLIQSITKTIITGIRENQKAAEMVLEVLSTIETELYKLCVYIKQDKFKNITNTGINLIKKQPFA